MVNLLKNRSCQHHLQMMGGSCARVCKTESGAARQTRRSPTHSHHKTMTMKNATIIAALLSSQHDFGRLAVPIAELAATGEG
ncbi:hypothetical protein B7L09_21335 [Pseudomonas mandelii]|nr:hypothetical protein B7L09_21335 [Pseudomonas mandelii]